MKEIKSKRQIQHECIKTLPVMENTVGQNSDKGKLPAVAEEGV